MLYSITFEANSLLLIFTIFIRSNDASFNEINKLFVDKLALIKVDNNQE